MGALILAAALSVAAGGLVFAATEIPVTAQARVAPEGQYAPVIQITDKAVDEGESLEFDVLATDANEPDKVHIDITQGQPAWLTIVSNIDNTPPGGTATMHLRAAPPQGTTGKYRVYFTATDTSAYALSSTKDIYITVNPSNHAPVITAQDQNVQVGSALTFNVNCQDQDSQDTVSLTYSATPSWPSWLTPAPTNPVTGNPINIAFSGTPQNVGASPYKITLTAVDSGSPQQTTTKDITITVSTVNHPPVLAPIRDKKVAVRVKLEFEINATDQDKDALTYSASGSPFSGTGTRATFDPSTRKFTWTPDETQAGSYYPVHFEVTDAGGLSASEDITIIVSDSGTNGAPVFDPLLDKYTKVGKTLSFVVIARDPNNDPVTYSASNVPANANFDSVTHSFTWSPQAGQEGAVEVTFTASDGTNTATKKIWISVSPFGTPDLEPISEQFVPYGEAHIRVGQTLSFKINATDPNSLPLTYSVESNPSGSHLVGQAFTWTPVDGQDGTYANVRFTVTNGLYSVSEAISIFVLPSTAPVIDPIGEKITREGQTLSFTVNASDPNGDTLIYSVSNLPTGAAFDTSTHTFNWKPAIGQADVYKNVIFSVKNSTSVVNEYVWITVERNDAPVIAPLPGEFDVKVGEYLSFVVSAYDPNGDPLTYEALNLPSNATFINRTFSWTPAIGDIGTHEGIIFEVSDGANVVTTGLWIKVIPVGAPIMTYIGDKYIVEGNPLTFDVTAFDPNGLPLSFTCTNNLPSGSTFVDNGNGSGTFNWATPQPGVYKYIYFTVSNGIYTDTKGIWITVKAAAAPTISVPTGELFVKGGKLLQFPVNATDPNNIPLTYSVENLPPGATFVNQVFSWLTTTDQVGTYKHIMFTASNGTYSDSNGLWITVTPAGAPTFDQHVTDKYGRIGEPIIFSVSATDPDGQPLTYSAYNLPSGATFTAQTFRWTPQPGQAGTYPWITLEVKDTDNNIDSQVFWIFIAKNSPPILDNIGTKYGNAGQPLTFTITATDPDTGDHLTFIASNLPQGADFLDNGNKTGTFTWTNPPAGTYNGAHFEVSDGALTDSEDISIVISP